MVVLFILMKNEMTGGFYSDLPIFVLLIFWWKTQEKNLRELRLEKNRKRKWIFQAKKNPKSNYRKSEYGLGKRLPSSLLTLYVCV